MSHEKSENICRSDLTSMNENSRTMSEIYKYTYVQQAKTLSTSHRTATHRTTTTRHRKNATTPHHNVTAPHDTTWHHTATTPHRNDTTPHGTTQHGNVFQFRPRNAKSMEAEWPPWCHPGKMKAWSPALYPHRDKVGMTVRLGNYIIKI